MYVMPFLFVIYRMPLKYNSKHPVMCLPFLTALGALLYFSLGSVFGKFVSTKIILIYAQSLLHILFTVYSSHLVLEQDVMNKL